MMADIAAGSIYLSTTYSACKHWSVNIFPIYIIIHIVEMDNANAYALWHHAERRDDSWPICHWSITIFNMTSFASDLKDRSNT